DFHGPGGEAGAQDGPGGTALAVAFEGDAGEAAGDEGEVVEGGPGARPQGAEAADAVAAQLGLGLDVLDDGGREGAAGRRGAGAGGRLRVGVRIHGPVFRKACGGSPVPVGATRRWRQYIRPRARTEGGFGQKQGKFLPGRERPRRTLRGRSRPGKTRSL